MVRVYKFLFQVQPQKYAYESRKKYSTPGEIYDEIKHNLCVNTLNGSI